MRDDRLVDRLVDTADLRNRPVVLESSTTQDQPRRRPRPRTIIGVSSAALLAAAGLVAGSWSIWSAVSTTTPAGPPAPLWFSPPAPVVTPDGGSPGPASTDDHGGTGTNGSGGNSGDPGTGPGAGVPDHGGRAGNGSGSDDSGRSSATTVPIKPTTNAPATGPPSGHSGPGRGGVAPTGSTKEGEGRPGGDHSGSDRT
ncbi:MAG: hypothetical protein ACJ72N_02165 [Labedaea sp.]